MAMIDPHLGVPVDAAYREETAQLLDQLGYNSFGTGLRQTLDRFNAIIYAATLDDHSRWLRAYGRRWSYLAAAHRLEMIARSLEEQ